jgi:hypothetical protein
MPRVGIKQCYKSPYQKVYNNLPQNPVKCHQYCNELYPYDSWGTIRYPNRLLHDSCHVRCNQENPGNEHFPDKDVQSVEFFGNFDNGQNLIATLIKYALEALAITLAAYYIPASTKPDWMEILKITGTSLLVFLVLDLFAPSVGSNARMGAGFGIGAKTVGWGF